MSSGFVEWYGNRFSSFIGQRIDARMRQTGEAMVARARQLVPVRTGFLQSTIGYIYRQSDKTVQLYADAPAAIFVEFGTIHMKARPYLRPAMAEAGRLWGGNTEIAFDTAPALKSAVANPRTAKHYANQAFNRATSTHFNRTAFGRAKQHVGRARRGHGRGPYDSTQ